MFSSILGTGPSLLASSSSSSSMAATNDNPATTTTSSAPTSPPSRAITPALRPLSPRSTRVSPLVLTSASRAPPIASSISFSPPAMTTTMPAVTAAAVPGDDSMLGKWVADDDDEEEEVQGQEQIVHRADQSSSSSDAWQPPATPVQRWIIKPRPKLVHEAVPATATPSPPRRSATATPPPTEYSAAQKTTDGSSTPARGILRPPRTLGTGSSVRFGMRLYNDGDESLFSEATSASLSLSQDPTYRFPASAEEESRDWGSEGDQDDDSTRLTPGLATPRIYRAVQRASDGQGDDDSLLAVEASLATEQSVSLATETSVNKILHARDEAENNSDLAIQKLSPLDFGNSEVTTDGPSRDETDPAGDRSSDVSSSLSDSRSGPVSPTVRMTLPLPPVQASTAAPNSPPSVSELNSLPTLDDVSALADASMGIGSLDLPSLLSDIEMASGARQAQQMPMGPSQAGTATAAAIATAALAGVPRSAKSSTESSTASQAPSDELSFSDSFLRREMANAVRDLELQQSAEKKDRSGGPRMSFLSVMSTRTPAPTKAPAPASSSAFSPSLVNEKTTTASSSSPPQRGTTPKNIIPSTSSPLPSPPRSAFLNNTSSTPTLGPTGLPIAPQRRQQQQGDESMVSSRGGWATPTWSAPGSAPGSERPSTDPLGSSSEHDSSQQAEKYSDPSPDHDQDQHRDPPSTSSFGYSDPSSPLADKAQCLGLGRLVRKALVVRNEAAVGTATAAADLSSASFSSAVTPLDQGDEEEEKVAAPSLSLLLGLIRDLDELHSLRGDALLAQVKQAESELLRLQSLRTPSHNSSNSISMDDVEDASLQILSLQASAKEREEQIALLTQTLEEKLTRRAIKAKEDKKRLEELERELKEEKMAREMENRDWEMRVAFAREDAQSVAGSRTASREASPAVALPDEGSRGTGGIDEEEVERRIEEARRSAKETFERDAEIRNYVVERQHAEALEALNAQLDEVKLQLEMAVGDSRARDEVAEELIERKEQVMDLHAQLEEARREIKELNSQVQQQRSVTETSKEQLESRPTMEAFEEVRLAHEKASSELRDTKMELEAQWKRTELATEVEEQLREEIKQLRTTLQRSEGEMGVVEEMKEELELAREAIREGDARIEGLEKQLDRTLDEGGKAMKDGEALVHSLEVQLEDAQSEISKLQYFEAELRMALKEQGERSASELAETRSRLSRLEVDLEALRSSESQARELLEQAEEARREGLEAQGKLQLRHAQLQAEYDALLDSVARLEKELCKADERAIKLREEMQSSKSAEKVEERPQDDTASQHQQQLLDQSSRITALEREVADRGIVISRLEKSNAKLEEENENYSIALSSKQQELSLLKRGPATRVGVGANRKSGVTLLDTLGRRSILTLPEASPKDAAAASATGVTSNQNGEAKRAQRVPLDSKAARGEEDEDLTEELQKGPAPAKALRRRTAGPGEIGIGARSNGPTVTTTARRGARPSLAAPKSSATSTTTSMGPPSARPTTATARRAPSLTTAVRVGQQSRESTMNLTATTVEGEVSGRSTSPIDAPPASLTLSFGGASVTEERSQVKAPSSSSEVQTQQHARRVSMAAPSSTSRLIGPDPVPTTHSRRDSISSVTSSISNRSARISSLTAPTRASEARRASVSGRASMTATAADEPMSLADLSTSASRAPTTMARRRVSVSSSHTSAAARVSTTASSTSKPAALLASRPLQRTASTAASSRKPTMKRLASGTEAGANVEEKENQLAMGDEGKEARLRALPDAPRARPTSALSSSSRGAVRRHSLARSPSQSSLATAEAMRERVPA